ncbi:DUF6397 family protein [Streptomyces sp. enrichment culture]|uniref:DUF6397 family protein n=1 Tax=Streptomyces sp. enrichment culture TaxID=1795815 RepID=UPI003F544364
MVVEQTGRTVAYGRAAQELALRRSEFDLAVHLRYVRTAPAPTGGRPRVPKEEIDRLRAEPGFPAGLRERVSTVGTAQAAELAGISPDRFTRLARTGHFSPVAYYLNRYRAVVWLYLAREVVDGAARHRELLTGRAPTDLRDRLKAGEDSRPRRWRARHRRLLLDRAADAWESAAVLASFLDPLQVAEIVPDVYERLHLERLRPAPPHGHPESPAARAVADRLLVADDPAEVADLREGLAEAVGTARTHHPAPRPGTVAANGAAVSATPRVQAPPEPATPAPRPALFPQAAAFAPPPSAQMSPVHGSVPVRGPASVRPGAREPLPVRADADAVAAAAAPPPAGRRVRRGATEGRVPLRSRRRSAPTAPAAPPPGRGRSTPPPPGRHPDGAPRTGFLARLGLRRPRVG